MSKSVLFLAVASMMGFITISTNGSPTSFAEEGWVEATADEDSNTGHSASWTESEPVGPPDLQLIAAKTRGPIFRPALSAIATPITNFVEAESRRGRKSDDDDDGDDDDSSSKRRKRSRDDDDSSSSRRSRSRSRDHDDDDDSSRRHRKRSRDDDDSSRRSRRSRSRSRDDDDDGDSSRNSRHRSRNGRHRSGGYDDMSQEGMDRNERAGDWLSDSRRRAQAQSIDYQGRMAKFKRKSRAMKGNLMIGWCTKCWKVYNDGSKGQTEAAVTDRTLDGLWMTVAIMMIIFGFFLWIFGDVATYITCFMIGFTLFFLPVFFLFCGLFGNWMPLDDWPAWTAMGLGFAAALGGMVLLIAMPTLGKMAAGASGGFIMACILNGLGMRFLYSELNDNDSDGHNTGNYVCLAINLVLMIGFGALGALKCMEDFVLIIATSFMGAYMVQWGSMYLIFAIDGLTSDNIVAMTHPLTLFAAEHWQGRPEWEVIMTLSLVVVFATFGVGVQWKVTATDKWKKTLSFLRPKEKEGHVSNDHRAKGAKKGAKKKGKKGAEDPEPNV